VSEDFDSICGAGNTAEDSERQRGRVMDYPKREMRAAVQTALDLLAQQQYQALASLPTSAREPLPADEIPWAMRSCPETVRMREESELEIDFAALEGLSPRQISADAGVFPVEEGQSAIAARKTMIDPKGKDYPVVFADAWVME
jgi:hypothetical protein